MRLGPRKVSISQSNRIHENDLIHEKSKNERYNQKIDDLQNDLLIISVFTFAFLLFDYFIGFPIPMSSQSTLLCSVVTLGILMRIGWLSNHIDDHSNRHHV